MKKIILLLSIIILLIVPLSAFELNPFAKITIYETDRDKIVNDFLKEDFNEDYGVIRISKTFLWIPIDRVAEYSLIENSNTCLLNCYAQGKAVLYQDGSLFEEFQFIGRDELEYFISYTIFIRKNITVEWNQEIIENNISLGFEKKSYTAEIWEEYNFEELTIGNYEWKIEGRKDPHTSIDWIPQSFGKQLTEWAWWDSLDGAFEAFTTNGTFTVPVGIDNVSVLVVAGGGGGGFSSAGGGGAGGLILNNSVPVTPGEEINVTVGDGGAGSSSSGVKGSNGTDSVFNASSIILIAIAGGGGGSAASSDGQNGGSGGGGRALGNGGIGTVGQGNDGGDQTSGNAGGGGGGASTAGIDGGALLGHGGNGTLIWALEFLSGGGGGGDQNSPGGTGGLGGGGHGGFGISNTAITNGTTNSGGGGGGGGQEAGGSFAGQPGEIGGTGLVVVRWIATPQITLNSPANNTVTNNATIIFNGSVISSFGVINVSLVLDGILNETNSTGINDTDYLFTKTISEGDHNWTYESCNSQGCRVAPVRLFTIDITNPVVNVTLPTGNQGKLIVGDLLDVNFTVVDLNTDSCFYDYNSTNISIASCTTNFSIGYEANNNNISIWANDTTGNLGFGFTTWTFSFIENNITFNNLTIEGSTEEFTLNLTVGSGVSISSAVFNYNDTNQSSTIDSSNSPVIIVTDTIVVPAVTTDFNSTFFWNITLGDGSSLNTSLNNQTIQNLNVSDCSVLTNVLMNLTLVDEGNQTILGAALLNTSIEVDIQISPFGSTTPVINFSKAYDDDNPAEVCLNIAIPTTVKYRLDSTIRYTADGYSQEHYHFQNFTLENTSIPQLVTLFDLFTVDSTEFRITFKNTNFVVVENALIQINRQYVAEGTFKTVEIPKTDTNGQAVAHLVEKDIVYNILVIKNGVLLGTFNNVVAFCDDVVTGACFINLNALGSNPDAANIVSSIGLISDFNYNETSRVLLYTFSTVDGSTRNVTVSSIKFDQLGTTSVCFESLISSSGTITCNVPASIGNETILIDILIEGDLVLQTSLQAGTEFNIGDAGFFLLLILLLSLGMMFLESKTAVIMSVIIGFITASLLSWIQGGILGIGSAVIWLIIMGLILIWKLNRDRET